MQGSYTRLVKDRLHADYKTHDYVRFELATFVCPQDFRLAIEVLWLIRPRHDPFAQHDVDAKLLQALDGCCALARLQIGEEDPPAMCTEIG